YSPYFLLKHEASSQSTDSLIYIRSKEYSVEELRPIITHYFSQFHQSAERVYVQSDEREQFVLKSPRYSAPISLNKGDYIAIDCEPKTSGQINLTLLTGGSELREFAITVQGNQNFERQKVGIQIDNDVTFDQFIFSGELDAKGKFALYGIKALKAPEPGYRNKFNLRDAENALSDWNEYISAYMVSDGVYGFELKQKLPIVDRFNDLTKEGLKSIHVAFDASIISPSFSKQYPYSLQMFDFKNLRWYSIPISPLNSYGLSYNLSRLNYDFWTFNPGEPGYSDKFRPISGTIDLNHLNSITFGDCFPHSISEEKARFNSSILSGANFLANKHSGNFTLNNYWIANNKYLFYEKSYQPQTSYHSNKFQLNNVVIDIEHFYTCDYDFPAPTSEYQFANYINKDAFYDRFVNDANIFKIRVITDKESFNPSEAYFAIGDFKTYSFIDTNYLNYDNFNFNAVNLGTDCIGQHVSDRIDLTESGIELGGNSGFALNPESEIAIFRETFGNNNWKSNASESIVISEPIESAVYINSKEPKKNFNGEEPIIRGSEEFFAKSDYIVEGSNISGSFADMHALDGKCRTYNSTGSKCKIMFDFKNSFDFSRGYYLNFYINASMKLNQWKISGDNGDTIRTKIFSESIIIKDLYIKGYDKLWVECWDSEEDIFKISIDYL
ncbi:MAG: hypothetical protein ACTSQ8_26880, partial [Candidatus Helarchaeota archaeon]